MRVIVRQRIDHNPKSVTVGANILFLHPRVTHTFPFHLCLTCIPLCNCTLIFQCQSGLCPQPYYLPRAQCFFHFFTTILTSCIFCSCFQFLPALDMFSCSCSMPLVKMCVCTLCGFMSVCTQSVFSLFSQDHLSLLFVCEQAIDKYNQTNEMVPFLFYLFAFPLLGTIHLWLFPSIAPFTLPCLLLLVTLLISPSLLPSVSCPDIFSFGL